MFKVEMEKQCGCFKKSDFQAEQLFDTKDEAVKAANEMCEVMNVDFCLTHQFKPEVQENKIVIKVSVRDD